MTKQLTLDEILSEYHIVLYKNLGKSETDWYELKQQLSQLIGSIIGEDTTQVQDSWQEANNRLRGLQRQRAKERGIDLNG